MVLSDDAGQSICCYLELGFHPQQHLTPDCSYRDELIARRQLRSVIQNRTKEPASETIRFDAGGWTAIRTVDLLRPQVKGPQLVFQPPQVCDSRFHLLPPPPAFLVAEAIRFVAGGWTAIRLVVLAPIAQPLKKHLLYIIYLCHILYL